MWNIPSTPSLPPSGSGDHPCQGVKLASGVGDCGGQPCILCEDLKTQYLAFTVTGSDICKCTVKKDATASSGPGGWMCDHEINCGGKTCKVSAINAEAIRNWQSKNCAGNEDPCPKSRTGLKKMCPPCGPGCEETVDKWVEAMKGAATAQRRPFPWSPPSPPSPEIVPPEVFGFFLLHGAKAFRDCCRLWCIECGEEYEEPRQFKLLSP